MIRSHKLFFVLIFALVFTSCIKENNWNTKSLITTNASPARYRDAVFSSVDTNTFFNVLFRVVPNFYAIESLRLDVYTPMEDTANKRAAIIFMHGGAFDTIMNRKHPSIVHSCIAYAKKGYVAISVSYRRGRDYESAQTRNDSLLGFYEAIYRASQDAKSAIRFIKKYGFAAKIDTSNIFIGGESAGAVTAINAALLQQNEVDSSFKNNWGPLDGTGVYDYPGYSCKVRGIINLEGAIVDTNYIDVADPPIFSAYGILDEYYRGSITLASPFIPFCNGQSIHKRTTNLGITTPPIITYPGFGHGVHSASIVNLNTSINTTANWMYELMN